MDTACISRFSERLLIRTPQRARPRNAVAQTSDHGKLGILRLRFPFASEWKDSTQDDSGFVHQNKKAGISSGPASACFKRVGLVGGCRVRRSRRSRAAPVAGKPREKW